MVSKIKSISLDRLIKGFPTYLKTVNKIFHNPIRFPDYVGKTSQFSRALDYFSYSIVVMFIIIIPIYIVHSEKISKTIFLFRMLFQVGLFGLILHLFLKLFGAHSVPMKKTLSVYGYLCGTTMPLYFLLQYPLLLKLGPVVIFGSGKEAFLAGQAAALTGQIGTIDIFYSYAANIVLSIVFLIVTVNWFHLSHKISKCRVCFSIFLSGLAGSPILLFVANPLLNQVSEWAEIILKTI